jgi:POT family proton-dependent oligopeptide transporter
MTAQEAQGYFHLFVSAVYFTPLLGALLADGLLGKYRTIMTLSFVYCLGHFALALDHTRLGLLIGQSLIALGAGGIKPCVSAHVGDQFAKTNQHLLGPVFSWFYFSINLGAFAAMVIIPWLLAKYGPGWAFGVPGWLMLVATLIFWMGRHRFVHIKPKGMTFVRDLFSRFGAKLMVQLGSVYLFVAIFWALFEQNGSSWVLQAQKLDRHVLGIEILPSQSQAANPLLIMLLTPLFSYWLYPQINRRIKLTELRKMAIGFFLTALAFAIPSFLQMRIDAGQTPSILWQLFAYVLLTSAEVMVSITCLEFSYRFAPPAMKSFVMALYMLSIALGNLLTGAVNFFIQNPDGSSKLAGSDYFWFFTILMLISSFLFLPVAARFKTTGYSPL